MKTLNIFFTATLMLFAVTVFGTDVKTSEDKGEKAVTSVQAPEFAWGDPADAEALNIEEAETDNTLAFPAFEWGSAEATDLQVTDEAELTLSPFGLPRFVWGDPTE